MHFRLMILTGLTLILGCGELGKLNTDGGNCNLTAVNVCLDYPDTSTQGTTKTSQCDALKTSFSTTTYSYTAGTGNDCPTTSLLGSCIVSAGTLRYYSGGQWNASSAQSNCTGVQSGTWTAGS